MQLRLLDAFRDLFAGTVYLHRKCNLGDHVVSHLYEDLYHLGHSSKLVSRVDNKRAVLNTANVTVGRNARRGDGTFGEAVPGLDTVQIPNFAVARGRIALVEVGAESKVLAKAMMKQIGRVVTDLRDQTEYFKRSNPRAICVAVVGINRSKKYTSFEGKREYVTDGKVYKHPSQEAVSAEQKLWDEVRNAFYEVIVLRFEATNQPPYPFRWVDEAETRAHYAAVLARISREYDTRF